MCCGEMGGHKIVTTLQIRISFYSQVHMRGTFRFLRQFFPGPRVISKDKALFGVPYLHFDVGLPDT